MKPWIALVIGILIGWLLGWLFEMWYSRRRRGAAVARRDDADALRSGESQWHEREIELPRVAAEPAAPVAGAFEPLADDLAAVQGVTASAASEASAGGVTATYTLPRDEREFEVPPEMDWQELHDEVQAAHVEFEPEIDREASIADELPSGVTGMFDASPFTPDSPPTHASLPDEALAAVAPTPDDLIVIEGIGPVYKAKLSAAGITTFARLAASSPQELDGIIQAPAWRKIVFEDWIEQARLLANNEQEKLRELQERLFRRKK